MASTPAQTAADERLVDAIDQQHRAYSPEAEGVITKYLVVAQRQWIDEDGDFNSDVYATTCDDMSLADTLGLCEFASTQFKRMIAQE